MKNKIFLLLNFLLIFILSIVLTKVLENSNPYLLKIEKNKIEEDSMEYEDLYEVARGSISESIDLKKKISIQCYDSKTIKADNDMTDIYIGKVVKAGKYFTTRYKKKFCEKKDIRIMDIKKNKNSTYINYIFASDFVISLTLDKKYINKITEKSKITVTVNGKPIKSKLVSVGPEIVNDKFRLRMLVIDEELLTWPGSSLNINIVLEEKTDVVYVPKNCLFINEIGQEYVLLKKGMDYEIRYVESGISDGNIVEVSKGISEGDIVYGQIDM